MRSALARPRGGRQAAAAGCAASAMFCTSRARVTSRRDRTRAVDELELPADVASASRPALVCSGTRVLRERAHSSARRARAAARRARDREARAPRSVRAARAVALAAQRATSTHDAKCDARRPADAAARRARAGSRSSRGFAPFGARRRVRLPTRSLGDARSEALRREERIAGALDARQARRAACADRAGGAPRRARRRQRRGLASQHDGRRRPVVDGHAAIAGRAARPPRRPGPRGAAPKPRRRRRRTSPRDRRGPSRRAFSAPRVSADAGQRPLVRSAALARRRPPRIAPIARRAPRAVPRPAAPRTAAARFCAG